MLQGSNLVIHEVRNGICDETCNLKGSNLSTEGGQKREDSEKWKFNVTVCVARVLFCTDASCLQAVYFMIFQVARYDLQGLSFDNSLRSFKLQRGASKWPMKAGLLFSDRNSSKSLFYRPRHNVLIDQRLIRYSKATGIFREDGNSCSKFWGITRRRSPALSYETLISWSRFARLFG